MSNLANLWEKISPDPTAADLYKEVNFNTDNLFNREAPSPYFTCVIALIFLAIGLWMFVKRVRQRRERMEKDNVPFDSIHGTRALISALVDCDSTSYTIVTYSAVSFVMLANLQVNYFWTYTTFSIFYVFMSTLDVLQILLPFFGTSTLKDLYIVSDMMRKDFSRADQLHPRSVYEDIGRSYLIVLMTFITQIILITFTAWDIQAKNKVNCFDGTPECPVVGTMGSWTLFVVGVFAANNYMLGPKTSYGQSEQNPAYWTQLFMEMKKKNARVTWFDPVKRIQKEHKISGDLSIWLRLFFSYLINGIGFHLLVHSLPLQLAKQTNYISVVFRFVGMMYLVDLDDTTGYTLKVVYDKTEEIEGTAETNMACEVEMTAVKPNPEGLPVKKEDVAESVQVQQIIDEGIHEAKLKLDALISSRRPTDRSISGKKKLY